MLNISLIGAGRIGKLHAHHLMENADCKIVYVADAFEENAIALAADTGAKVVSAEEAISAKDVDAVIIASPTDTHSHYSHLALDAGKAIFCEKPIDLDLSRAKKIADHVGETNLPYMLGFNRRFDPSFMRLKEQLPLLGKLEQVLIVSRDPSPPPVSYIEHSGGLFKDMMIHDLDIARWLLPEEPTEIFAVGDCLVDPEIATAGDIDTAMVTLKTKSGIQCQIINSRRAAYGYDQRIEAFGEAGILKADNPTETTTTFMGKDGATGDKIMHFFLERYADAYRLQLNAFVDSVVNGSPAATTVDDGVKALRLAEAAKESLDAGKLVTI